MDTAEKKRILKENTKKEMKRLQKLVIERNAKEQEVTEKEAKVRKVQSSVRVVGDGNKERPKDSEENHKPVDLKLEDGN